MVQLIEVASQLKSRLETVLTKLKSTENDRSTSTSSASPTAANPESLNNQTARVVESVFNTLFGACNGTNCASKDDSQNITASFRKKSILTKAQRTQLQTLKTSGSNLESRYAQHYQDDHGRAARAVLMASEREEHEQMSRRKQWQNMNREATAEAQESSVLNRRKTRRNIGSGQPTKQHKKHLERMKVNGNGLSLTEVEQSFEEESESGVSVNFDDGISALSAHTLEEMAKAEVLLLRQQRLSKEPQEQGFDISIDNSSISGPPSPTSTDNSDSTGEMDGDEHTGKPQTMLLDVPRPQYPTQMARNRPQMESDLSSTMQTSTSPSELADTWPSYHPQPWKQMSKNDSKNKNDSPSKVRTCFISNYSFFICSFCQI